MALIQIRRYTPVSIERTKRTIDVRWRGDLVAVAPEFNTYVAGDVAGELDEGHRVGAACVVGDVGCERCRVSGILARREGVCDRGVRHEEESGYGGENGCFLGRVNWYWNLRGEVLPF